MRVLVLYDYPPSPGGLASKGAQEVMQALVMIDTKAPDWKYVCKVWPQQRTEKQNMEDLKLAHDFGFNEWIQAQDGLCRGQDWRTWSAGMYLYAAKCVESGTTPLFDALRGSDW